MDFFFSFGIGAKLALDKDAAVRAKINNSSQIGLGYQQKLRDGKFCFIQIKKLKVRLSQNEYMKSSIFRFVFWKIDDFIYATIHSDLI